MTERMENAIRHIKSGVDVDPWAAEEVERVFKAVDEIKTEIINKHETYVATNRTEEGLKLGLMVALHIIEKHIIGKDEKDEDCD